MQLEHHQNTNQHSHSLFTAELGTIPIRACADLCARLLALMDLRQPWLRALAILRNPGSTEFLNTRLLSLYKLLTVIGCLRVLGCLIPLYSLGWVCQLKNGWSWVLELRVPEKWNICTIINFSVKSVKSNCNFYVKSRYLAACK